MMKLFYNWDATTRSNANMAIKARYTIAENKNNKWRGYDRNYTIKWETYNYEYNYMTIGGGWGVLEYIDEDGSGYIITLHNITKEGLDIVSVETFRNYNRNITKRYTHEKYLKKYTRLAYMVFTLVNCGYIDTNTKAA